MDNKLQELTKKLYEEGLMRGREEADTLLAEAEFASRQLVSEAQKEAERIVNEARREAESLKLNSFTEINLAGRQAISELKTSINDIIIAKNVAGPVKAAMDPEFVKELLLTIARNWRVDSPGNVSLKALLPDDMKSRLNAEFREKVISELNNGLEITFSDKVKTGFKIGPQGGGYYVSFTDADFETLLRHHLHKKVSDILYGEND